MPVRLTDLVAAMERIAPPELAEDWDNVGLLIAPPRRVTVRRCLLTIDLTEAVLAEARARRAEAVVAYHPPIFAGLRRLVGATASERVVLGAVAGGIAVYSPHTALDATAGGVNDWLASGLGRGRVRALAAASPDDDTRGQGRHVELAKPAGIDALVRRIKRHLGLRRVRVAAAARHAGGGAIRTVALCAGAGGSVLVGRSADLWWTGELRHHDVLAANAAGTSVVLCDHTNTERGFLPTLAGRLAAELDGAIDVAVAERDADPLRVL